MGTDKVQTLAEKIAQKVAETLAPLEREMRIMKWPDEYRRIMWEAVVVVATNRARPKPRKR